MLKACLYLRCIVNVRAIFSDLMCVFFFRNFPKIYFTEHTWGRARERNGSEWNIIKFVFNANISVVYSQFSMTISDCISLICFAEHDTSHRPHINAPSIYFHSAKVVAKRWRNRTVMWNFVKIRHSFGSTNATGHSRRRKATIDFPWPRFSFALNCIAHLWCSQLWQPN